MRGIISLLASGNINKTKKLEIFSYFCQTTLGGLNIEQVEMWPVEMFVILQVAGSVLYAWEDWCRPAPGSLFYISWVTQECWDQTALPAWLPSSYSRACPVISEPTVLTGGGAGEGASTGSHSPLKTHTDHHIAQNNKNWNISNTNILPFHAL